MMSQEEREALERQPRVRKAEVIEVIRVISVEGRLDQQQGPDDVVREVATYYLPSGVFLMRSDPCEGAPT